MWYATFISCLLICFVVVECVPAKFASDNHQFSRQVQARLRDRFGRSGLTSLGGHFGKRSKFPISFLPENPFELDDNTNYPLNNYIHPSPFQLPKLNKNEDDDKVEEYFNYN